MSDHHPPDSYTGVIPGPARGYQRARHKGRVHWHTPEHVAYMRRVEVLGREAVQVLGEVELATVTIVVHHKARRKMDVRRAVFGKPDLDNVAKIVLDGLTAAGLWVDDTRCVGLTLARVGCAKGDECVSVTITKVGGAE